MSEIAFYSPVPRSSGNNKSKSKSNHDNDMDLDDMISSVAKSSSTPSTLHVVTPGEVITTDSAYMR